VNKADLKQLIKPLVKECIHEVLLEEGLLSNVVAEVAKGMQGNLMVEAQQPQVPRPLPPRPKQNTAQRQKIMKAVGADAYNGVNLFEGTEAMTSYEAADSKPGSVDLGDPTSAGVDISSLVGGAGRMWNALK